MKKYLTRKLLMYILTFFVAISINWLIPRAMPGDPLASVVSKLARGNNLRVQEAYETLVKQFGFDKPLHEQYFNYMTSLFQGDLGISLSETGKPVTDVIIPAMPWTLFVTIPALALSFILGNKLGAAAARRKGLDSTLLPIGYLLTSTPALWLGLVFAWFFGTQLQIFPIAFPYAGTVRPGLNIRFILSLFHHWFLPFFSLFLWQLGGWAIGMRNMIIYELESDYSKYLKTLGAPESLVRRYAYKNARLPQITGIAIQLGMMVVGQITTEVVFQYPGIGKKLVTAILNKDYFVVQGGFLMLVITVLLANFIIDMAYAFIDPRVRFSMAGD